MGRISGSIERETSVYVFGCVIIIFVCFGNMPAPAGAKRVKVCQRLLIFRLLLSFLSFFLAFYSFLSLSQDTDTYTFPDIVAFLQVAIHINMPVPRYAKGDRVKGTQVHRPFGSSLSLPRFSSTSSSSTSPVMSYYTSPSLTDTLPRSLRLHRQAPRPQQPPRGHKP